MIEIELPWPVKEVWPNWRQSHHYRTYASAVKAQRAMAYGLTLSAATPEQRAAVKAIQGRIPLSVTFVQPDRRHRDDDGMIGAFKSARDGIAEALGVDDRQFRATYHFADEPEKPGKIVVRVG